MTINTQIKHLKKIKIKLTLKFTQMTKVQNRCEIETQFSERDREEKKMIYLFHVEFVKDQIIICI